MIKTIVMMLALCMVVACGTDCPEPPECPECPIVECDSCCPNCPECPECPETLVCPEGYELEKEPLEWECEKISDANPKDYYRLNVGAGIINAVEVDSRTDIYVGIWVSCRNLRNAATDCADLIQPTFDMSAAELYALGDEGCALRDKWRSHWRENFSTENRRAAEYPKFEGYSNVRKEYWRPFEAKLRAHNAAIAELNEIVGQDPIHQTCNYDNVQGWCGCKK